jgi:hypothetical protein
MKWRIVRAPDRWALVEALMKEPYARKPLELFITGERSSTRRAVPAFVTIDAVAHGQDGVLDVTGNLVAVRDRRRPPLPVKWRLWTTHGTGTMASG